MTGATDRFVQTTTLFGKQYDWWSINGVLTLLPHVEVDVSDPSGEPPL